MWQWSGGRLIPEIQRNERSDFANMARRDRRTNAGGGKFSRGVPRIIVE